MVRIDFLIFGYRRLEISPDDLSRVSSILINKGIASAIGSDGTIIIRERDCDKIQGLLQGRIIFNMSDSLGIYGRWLRVSHKKAILAALAISILILSLSSLLVWDVRVDGNQSIPDSEIIYELSQKGFEVGSLWGRVDKSEVETSFLKDNPGISWININRRGTVAYVSVIEREADESLPDAEAGYSNIVATHSCVIEEITVKNGTAMVKPGDVVKKGDILICGIYSTEGGGFCRAEGEVIGRVNDVIEVDLSRSQTKKVYTGRRLYSITLNFFKFSLNIFKLYRNLTRECDIIDYEKSYSLFGRCRLPFSIDLKFIREYEDEGITYTDTEIVKIASDRLSDLLATRLVGCDLIKIRTEGNFTENGYYIYSDVNFLCGVGVEQKFEAD